MKRAVRPKPPCLPFALLAGGVALLPFAAGAQTPLVSSYSTRDGHIVSYVLGCASVDGTFTAQPCGISGYPIHVTVDGGGVGGGSGGTPTTAAGSASAQLVGVQGGGQGALPVTVSAAALPLPTGAATAANQPRLGADGGGLAHVTNPGVPDVPVSAQTLALGTAGNTVTIATGNAEGTLSFTVTGLSASGATLQPRAANDGGTVYGTASVFGGTAAAPNTAIVADGTYSMAIAGHTQVQLAVAAAGTGSATVKGNLSGASRLITLGNALPPGGSHLGSVNVDNLPAVQAVSAASLPLPAGAATAANQAALNTDGGSQVHVTNLPAMQLVSGTVNVGAFPQAARSSAWADASFSAGTAASVPAGLAAVAARTGLHVWNLGAATACLNYTAAAAASGSGCAAGSVPIPAGSAYLEDQPGNVSPEAISLVCAGSACPLTIKVR